MIKDPSLIETPATNDRPPKDIFSLVFSVIVVLLITSFALYEYRSHKERFLKDIENDLNSIANLKSQEISRYIRERLENGNILFRRDTFYNSIKRMEEDPSDKANQEYLKKWLNRYGSHYQYENAFILDKEGAIILSAPRDQKYVPAGISSELPKILQRNNVELVNFYLDDKNGRIYLGVAVPILSENPADAALGAMVLLINPESYLYPFIKKWPVVSQTAETLLVQRDGNYVLFLNDLRFSENSALNLRLELDKNKRVPAVMAVEGRRGFVEGIDYRGTPVVAYITPVENTPWLLVAKMGKKEAFAPLIRDMLSVVLITASVILVVISILWFLSRRKVVLFYKEQYALSEELRRLQYELAQAKETQYRSLIENLPQKVFLKDRNSVYISCNQNYANDLGIDAKDIRQDRL